MKVIVRIRWDLPWLDAEKRDRFPQRCTSEWQQERWRLFERYTLPSLMRQTHEDWEAWLLCDPSLASLHFLQRPASGVIKVYNTREAARRIDEAVFLMRIDSDDMLAPDALAEMVHLARYRNPSDRPFVQLDHGVAWHEPTETLYRWVNPSPPFYGLIVTGEDVFEKRDLPGLGHHGEARARARVFESDDPSFCVVLHGANISNSKDGSWVRGTIEGDRRAEIMRRFGL